MKFLATIFLIPMTFLIFQPLLSASKGETKMHCTKKMQCHKSKEKKTGDCNSNRDCSNCNPFMACSIGNFFLAGKNDFEFAEIASLTPRIVSLNDYRLASGLSDCWHPPESA